MIPEERAQKTMVAAFKDAAFDPAAFASLQQVMAKAIREAIAEEREACAKVWETTLVGTDQQFKNVGEAIRARK